MKLVKRFFVIGLALSFVHPLYSAPAIAPQHVVNLIADPDFKDFTHHLNPRSLETERKKIWWINDDKQLHVGGRGLGYLRTNKRYRDYHLVLEYMWGERTWSSRADRARDCGLLLHAYGKDGEFADTWMNCIEAQLIEGGSGDILTLAWKPTDGPKASTALTAEVENDRDGEPVWTKGGESRVFPPANKTNARINWKHRSPDWADVRGYRGPKDVENPVGEWNRMEVICRGDTIRIFLNGVLVNEGRGANPSEGFIGLQSEFAECLIRRWELHPLGSFKEKWTPEKRATDMGYSITGENLMPRRFPLSPRESQKLWQIDSDKYEIQLAAAEPLVNDPVDVVWDAQGRMYVAEMRDYPTPGFGGGRLSRVRLLSDTDADGRMDKAVTWADELDHVQGLLPIRGGLLITTWSEIIFLKDSDGDGRADGREVLFRSNAPRHNQLQISCPRWGLDNAIYLNNGLDGKEIYPVHNPEAKLAFTRLNLRYDPRTKVLEPVTGAGQFGASQDNFGRRFFCSNRNPAMFAVMPRAAVKRNPLAGITVGHEDTQPQASPVYPLALSHTTSAAHAGTHTAACGLGIYRANLMPGLSGNLFVCDPTAQLVTRNRLKPNGASFTAERVGEKRDFLVSGDVWTRPVNVRNGPDGALYVCDMYRQFIDHARFLPEDFQKTHYLRAGLDHGRIWRLVPKGTKSSAPKPLPDSVTELVNELKSPIAWRRIHAQRLLVEKGDAAAIAPLRKLLDGNSPTARVHAMWTLHGLDGSRVGRVAKLMRDPDTGVAENALTLATRHFVNNPAVVAQLNTLASGNNDRLRFLAAIQEQASAVGAEFLRKNPADVWIRRAFASTHGKQAGQALRDLLADPSFVARAEPGHADTLEELATLTAANGDVSSIVAALGELESRTGWPHFAVLNGINSGLRKSSLKTKSLAALVAKPPAEFGDGAARIRAVLKDAASLALDRSRAEVDRIAALPLVAQQGFDRAIPVIEKLIALDESANIQAAACRSLSRFNREQVGKFFFERWDSLPPTPLREALRLITSNARTGLALMKKMKAGEIPSALMPPMTRWSYGRSRNEEIKKLAHELFGQAAGNRAQIVNQYRSGFSQHRGDPEKGKAVFAKAACITCHQLGDAGVDVGPSLADVKIKLPEALITDILDPNRAVEERWISWVVDTKDGRTLAGLVQAENAAGVTLRLPGGLTETIPRGEIRKITASGMSLMPEGMEAAITQAEMADLIAFLKQR